LPTQSPTPLFEPPQSEPQPPYSYPYPNLTPPTPKPPPQRLEEEPTIMATLADLTCDSDGKVDKFINPAVRLWF